LQFFDLVSFHSDKILEKNIMFIVMKYMEFICI